VVKILHKDLKVLQQKLGLSFHKPQLLKQAFTHSSYVNEHRMNHLRHNERLEFLGDAVLELLVSDYLFHAYPDIPEGELTKYRASIVCEPSLVKHAEQLELGSYVLLGKGEEHTGGRTRPALLADLFESLVGALYLDQGIAEVKRFLNEHMFTYISIDGKLQVIDYKTKLQEHCQQHNMGTLEYRIVDERGPAHEREFVSEVYLDATIYGQGTGRSKKESEQQAAAQALAKLNVFNL
jgi:ribonuclease-3